MLISQTLSYIESLLNVILTHQMPVLSSYRNQSIDLHSKSIDWFLYEGNTGISWVNVRKLSSHGTCT